MNLTQEQKKIIIIRWEKHIVGEKKQEHLAGEIKSGRKIKLSICGS